MVQKSNNMPEENKKPLAIIQKNASSQIWFQERSYKGFRYLDIRTYVQINNAGDYIPSKKGITLGTTVIGEFARKMNEINKLFHERKIL